MVSSDSLRRLLQHIIHTAPPRGMHVLTHSTAGSEGSTFFEKMAHEVSHSMPKYSFVGMRNNVFVAEHKNSLCCLQPTLLQLPNRKDIENQFICLCPRRTYTIPFEHLGFICSPYLPLVESVQQHSMFVPPLGYQAARGIPLSMNSTGGPYVPPCLPHPIQVAQKSLPLAAIKYMLLELKLWCSLRVTSRKRVSHVIVHVL
jgi:hypothetical protein